MLPVGSLIKTQKKKKIHYRYIDEKLIYTLKSLKLIFLFEEREGLVTGIEYWRAGSRAGRTFFHDLVTSLSLCLYFYNILCLLYDTVKKKNVKWDYIQCDNLTGLYECISSYWPFPTKTCKTNVYRDLLRKVGYSALPLKRKRNTAMVGVPFVFRIPFTFVF